MLERLIDSHAKAVVIIVERKSVNSDRYERYEEPDVEIIFIMLNTYFYVKYLWFSYVLFLDRTVADSHSVEFSYRQCLLYIDIYEDV